MTDADDAARLVEVTIARFGRIDVLINNAGRAMAKPVEHIDLAEYTGLLWLNVLAPCVSCNWSSRGCAKKAGGRSSTSALRRRRNTSPSAGYASTKSALNTLSLTAREELAKDGITVSIIKPGIIDTDFGRKPPDRTGRPTA